MGNILGGDAPLMIDAKTYRLLAADVADILGRWDPIGVLNGASRPAKGGESEYGSYVPGVIGLLVAGATPPELVKYLEALARNDMEVAILGESTNVAAKELYDTFLRHRPK